MNNKDEGMITLDAQSQLKIDIIVNVFSGKVSIRNAAKILNKSPRTIERYLSKYKDVGILFAVHQNSQQSPPNKINDKLKNKVQNLIKKKYFDLNLTHLNEKLKTVELLGVKRETLRKWAHEINHVKRSKNRKPKVRKRRDRMESPGLMLQMDGSHHNWFGDKKTCLISIIDDSNSELHAEFFDAETTLGCMKVLKDLIKKKGTFKTLYVDRAGIFGGPKRCHFSQVKRACEELGIQIIFANSAEAKGRIERSFDTLQDRLVPELRLNKATTMEKANRFLSEIFIPEYWSKHIQVEPIRRKSEYGPLTKSKRKDLESIFTIKNYRKIGGDHTFSNKGKVYAIKSKLKSSLKGFKIEIRTDLQGNDKCYFADNELIAEEVRAPTRASSRIIEAKERIDAVKLSEKLNSVAEASRRLGVSRQIIYRTKDLLTSSGESNFMKNYKKGHIHNNPSKLKRDEIVIKHSLENPHLGEDQMSLHLIEQCGLEISSGGVRGVWVRHSIETIGKRVSASKNRCSKELKVAA
jgi:transposase